MCRGGTKGIKASYTLISAEPTCKVRVASGFASLGYIAPAIMLQMAMPKGVQERNLWISVTEAHKLLILLFCVDYKNAYYDSETPNNDGHPDKNVAV